MVAGANKEGCHYKGLNLERDLGKVEYVDIAKIKEGGICPCCKKHSISIKRGIEVGKHLPAWHKIYKINEYDIHR